MPGMRAMKVSLPRSRIHGNPSESQEEAMLCKTHMLIIQMFDMQRKVLSFDSSIKPCHFLFHCFGCLDSQISGFTLKR